MRRVLPVRRCVNGSRPGITGVGPNGPERGDTEQWVFPRVRLTEKEKNKIMAVVIKIITETMFRTHVYTFGGKVFRQSNGGPIGLRSTCSVARLVMKIWDNKWLARLSKMMVKIEAATRYMDDGRTALHPLRHGWRWTGKTIAYSKKWEEEDSHLSKIEVTRRILHGTMQGIEDFLEFTTETEEEFDGWLPSLDTNLAVNEDNLIIYKFFEKPMTANTVLHQRTAMPEDSKIRSLANDLTRRMLTTSERVPDSIRREIVDMYAQKLLNSGYTILATRRIIVAGLKGYEKKVMNSKKVGGKKLLRTAKESFQTRTQKKLLERTEWFKDDEKKREREEELCYENLPEEWKERKRRRTTSHEEENQPDPWRTPTSQEKDPLPEGWKKKRAATIQVRGQNSRTQKAGKITKAKEEKFKTRSILFVIGSKRGILAKNLREVTRRLRPVVGYNTKIVEKAGRKLKNILPNTNPWKGQPCGRIDCTTCL